MEIKDLDEGVPITKVCKADILMCYEDDSDKELVEDVKKKLAVMDKDDLEYLASKMADDYIEQLFWGSLKHIFEYRFLYPDE